MPPLGGKSIGKPPHGAAQERCLNPQADREVPTESVAEGQTTGLPQQELAGEDWLGHHVHRQEMTVRRRRGRSEDAVTKEVRRQQVCKLIVHARMRPTPSSVMKRHRQRRHERGQTEPASTRSFVPWRAGARYLGHAGWSWSQCCHGRSEPSKALKPVPAAIHVGPQGFGDLSRLAVTKLSTLPARSRV